MPTVPRAGAGWQYLSKRVDSGLPLGRRLLALLAVVALLGFAAPSQPASAAPTSGEWSELAPWDFIPIHAFVDEYGRIITYGSTRPDEGTFDLDIWTPRRGFGADAHVSVPNTLNTNLFCSISVTDPLSRKVRILGGQTNQSRFNDFAATFDGTDLTEAEMLEEGRWYPTATALPDGRILLQGGIPNGFDSRDNPIQVAEIFEAGSGWRTLEGTRNPGVWATENYGWWYPKSHVTPAGRIWNMAWDEMYYIDPDDNDGDASVTRLGQFPTGNHGSTSASVMFHTGLVLQVGGGERGSDDTRFPGSKQATVIDLNVDPPQLTQVSDMNFGRHWADALVLPDGRVLVAGGSETNNENVGVAFAPEIWDPATDSWTVLAANATPRLYHSTSLLMPDGRIFTGGGGAPGPQDNLDAEIFSPPYLFAPDGSRAEQPALGGIPDRLDHGDNFSFQADRPLGRVTMIRMQNSTHSLNSQIFQELSFTQIGGNVTTSAPGSANVTPPGLYMLFGLSEDGVPSEAAMIWLEPGTAPEPTLVADVNCDGVVDNTDAQFITEYVAGIRDGIDYCSQGLGTLNILVADANGDGTVNIVDALVIAQS